MKKCMNGRVQKIGFMILLGILGTIFYGCPESPRSGSYSFSLTVKNATTDSLYIKIQVMPESWADTNPNHWVKGLGWVQAVSSRDFEAVEMRVQGDESRVIRAFTACYDTACSSVYVCDTLDITGYDHYTWEIN